MLNRGGAETQSENQLTEKIIGCAIEVHKALGPGLLESAYEECFCYELAQNGIFFVVRFLCRSFIKESSWTVVIE